MGSRREVPAVPTQSEIEELKAVLATAGGHRHGMYLSLFNVLLANVVAEIESLYPPGFPRTDRTQAILRACGKEVSR